MVIHGRNLIISAGGTALAASKSCTISLKADLLEISTPMSGDYKGFMAGRKEWTISTSHLLVAATTAATPLKDMLARVGQTYSLSVSVSGLTSDTISGSAICADAQVTGTVGNLCTGSFKFVGTGELI